MNILSNLKDYALENFYPVRATSSSDGKEYKTRNEQWDEWMTSEYINGVWYLLEDAPTTVGEIKRVISSYVYYVDQLEENDIIAVKTLHFSEKQKINCSITYDDDLIYTTVLSKYNDTDYFIVTLPSEMSTSNIQKIKLQANQVTEDYYIYKKVPLTTYNSCVIISNQEFNKLLKKEIIQKFKKTPTLTWQGNTYHFKNLDLQEYNTNQVVDYKITVLNYEETGSIMEKLDIESSVNLNTVTVDITVYPYREYEGLSATLTFTNLENTTRASISYYTSILEEKNNPQGTNEDIGVLNTYEYSDMSQ